MTGGTSRGAEVTSRERGKRVLALAAPAAARRFQEARRCQPSPGGPPMSMGMQAYLVDEDELKAVYCSNDDELLEWLLDPKEEEALAELDEDLAGEMEHDCPGFTHA